jgi:hypothetical protein
VFGTAAGATFSASDSVGASGGGAYIYRLLLLLNIYKNSTILTIFSKKPYFLRLLAWSSPPKF